MRHVSALVPAFVVTVCFVLLHGPVCFAQNTATQKSGATTGLAIGKKAPDFVLNDQSGEKLQLSEFAAKGPVAIVFHRSAEW